MKHTIPFAFLALAGCASVSFHDLKEEKASQRAQREERDGLVVSCQPLASPDQVEYLLGVDLLGHGVLPVAVYLENRGERDTFTFVPERSTLTFEDRTTIAHVPWKDVYEDVCFSYWPSVPGFLFLVVPGILAVSSASSANASLADCFSRSVLEEISLPPGDRAQGVVFLRPERGAPLRLDRLSNADLRLAFRQAAGRRTVPVDIVYHLYTGK